MRGKILSGILSVGLLSAALIAGCGGGGLGSDTGTTTGSTTGTTSSSACASLPLIASSSVLPSASSTQSSGVIVTALCKNSQNNLVPGATVSFATSGGGIVVTQGTTDSSGTATAVLTTGGDKANQVLTVTASSGSAKSTISVTESGTALSVSGPSVVASQATGTFTARLTDSSGTGISGQSLSISATKNAVTKNSNTTDSSGNLTFTYTGTNGGSDTIVAQAAALNASTSAAVTVSTYSLLFPTATIQSLSITNPSPNSEVDLGVSTALAVQYSSGVTPLPGASIKFSTTRGWLNGTTATTATVSTNQDGYVVVTLQSSDGSNSTPNSGAGSVLITAQAPDGSTVTLPLILVATKPASINLQASPTTIAPTAKSTITATVRDPAGNFVANKLIDFSLTGSGAISAGQAYTDLNGQAAIQYTAAGSTGKDGVVINALVDSAQSIATSPGSPEGWLPAYLTVGGTAVRITLGTSGNTVVPYSDTQVAANYTVQVTDTSGAPAPSGTVVSLAVVPVGYRTGTLYQETPGESVWSIRQYPRPSLDYPNPICANEDTDYTGIYSTAKDYNLNYKLDPNYVPSILPTNSEFGPLTGTTGSSLTLDSTGQAYFELLYLKDHAPWVEVEVFATVLVSGTQSVTSQYFTLAGLETDYEPGDTTVPGQISPYGGSSDGCNVIEDPQFP